MKERAAHTVELNELLKRQREYFATGATLPLRERKRALARLGKTLRANEDRLCKALEADLGKSRSESYLCELGMVHSELHHLLKNLDGYAADRRVRTPLAQFPAKSFVRPCPKGCVLIVSPWNYPVLLTLGPLADALAAGNTAILKPSAYSPNTSRLLRELVDTTFPPELVTVVTGGGRRMQSFSPWPSTTSSSRAARPWAKRCCARRRSGLSPSPWSWGARAPASWTRRPTSHWPPGVSSLANSSTAARPAWPLTSFCAMKR